MSPKEYFYEICSKREDTLQCVQNLQNHHANGLVLGISSTILFIGILMIVWGIANLSKG